MAVTLKQVEAVPAVYPALPDGLSTAAAELDAAMIWARIESYTAHRFTVRSVTWIVEGAGEFSPPLVPVSDVVGEIWLGSTWTACALDPSPFGFLLQGVGPYRITATVGGGDVPAPVLEAFRRLAEYMADDLGTAGASSTSVAIGPIQEALDRNPAWMAKAMQNSGAGDLLRPYRRA